VGLTKHHAMKTYWGNGGIAPLILWPRHKKYIPNFCGIIF